MKAALYGSITASIILVLFGGVAGIFLEAAWPRYVTLVGTFGWAFCGITLLKMRKRAALQEERK